MSENIKQKVPVILIAEDDRAQKQFLVDIAKSQVIQTLEDKSFSEEQREIINSIKILSVTNIQSLERIAEQQNEVILVILDCNMPDTKGTASHDQFVKTNYKITGQHRSVDIVLKYLPKTPITMISSLNRFKRIIHSFYKSKLGIDINFINKSDPSTISRNIRYSLAQHLKQN